MIDKHVDGDEVVVTFTHPVDGDSPAAVVGEFNDWSPDRHPMTSDGAISTVSIRLAPGRAYRFRYLIDGARWENDWQADRYEPNDFGGDDSVVDLTGLGAAAKAPAKKARAGPSAPETRSPDGPARRGSPRSGSQSRRTSATDADSERHP